MTQKTENTSDGTYSNYDASNGMDLMYVHNIWCHMPNITVMGNTFWHREQIIVLTTTVLNQKLEKVLI